MAAKRAERVTGGVQGPALGPGGGPGDGARGKFWFLCNFGERGFSDDFLKQNS